MIWCLSVVFLFCKQKTAYEMRISDWSSDVCSSDLLGILYALDHEHGDDRRQFHDFIDSACHAFSPEMPQPRRTGRFPHERQGERGLCPSGFRSAPWP